MRTTCTVFMKKKEKTKLRLPHFLHTPDRGHVGYPVSYSAESLDSRRRFHLTTLGDAYASFL